MLLTSQHHRLVQASNNGFRFKTVEAGGHSLYMEVKAGWDTDVHAVLCDIDDLNFKTGAYNLLKTICSSLDRRLEARLYQ